MKVLSKKQIEKFASREMAKRIAVENFLSSLTGDFVTDKMNLAHDAKLYQWNFATWIAIRNGLKKAYKNVHSSL